jgi:hypothetical protein
LIVELREATCSFQDLESAERVVEVVAEESRHGIQDRRRADERCEEEWVEHAELSMEAQLHFDFLV